MFELRSSSIRDRPHERYICYKINIILLISLGFTTSLCIDMNSDSNNTSEQSTLKTKDKIPSTLKNYVTTLKSDSFNKHTTTLKSIVHTGSSKVNTTLKSTVNTSSSLPLIYTPTSIYQNRIQNLYKKKRLKCTCESDDNSHDQNEFN